MRQGLRLAWPLRLAAVALTAAGCLPSISDLDNGPLNSTFAVSDFFAPSGYMGDGEFFGNLQGTTNEGCKPRPAGARGNCYSFTYRPNNIDVDPWAGVFWAFPANSWGSTPGHAIDISRFKQISFYAAIVGPTPYMVDGNQVPFVGQAGGIDPKGGYASKGEVDYVDGVKTSNAWLVGAPDGITTEMKQFHVPIADFDKYRGCQDPAKLKELGKAPNCTGGEAEFMDQTAQATFLIGAFAWALHYPTDIVKCADPNVDCHSGLHSSMFVDPLPVKIYLDDIVWDTQEAPTP
jgi:hypothetical protein